MRYWLYVESGRRKHKTLRFSLVNGRQMMYKIRCILYKKENRAHKQNSWNYKNEWYGKEKRETHRELWGFPGGSMVKQSACQCRRWGFNPWVRKIPWRRKWQPTPAFLPGKFHEQRNLEGYSPWGLKELDMT